MLTIEYCARAVIQHLNGNFKLFDKYRNKAIETHEKDMITIGDLISESTKRKLYEMVS